MLDALQPFAVDDRYPALLLSEPSRATVTDLVEPVAELVESLRAALPRPSGA